MVDPNAVEAVARHYATPRQTPAEVLEAFDRAREAFVDEDIEWVEPFGTFRGAEQVANEMLAFHTQHLEYLTFNAEHCFPTRGNEVCVAGRTEGKFPSGPRFGGAFVHIWEFRGDRAVRMTSYNEDGVIQKALGLPPDASPEDVFAAIALQQEK